MFAHNMTMGLLHLPLLSSLSTLTSSRNLSFRRNFYVSFQMNKRSIVDTKVYNTSVVRRSANYQPPIWKHEFVESLTSEFTVMCRYNLVCIL